jgi:hypothetical protein
MTCFEAKAVDAVDFPTALALSRPHCDTQGRGTKAELAVRPERSGAMRVKRELAACGVGDGLGVRSLPTGMSPAEGVEELDGEVGEAEEGEGREFSIGESEVEGRLPRRVIRLQRIYNF